jgi:hypothetical protein
VAAEDEDLAFRVRPSHLQEHVAHGLARENSTGSHFRRQSKSPALAIGSQEAKCYKVVALGAGKRFHFTAAKCMARHNYVRGLVVEMFDTFPT